MPKTRSISDERLTSSSRAGATSTVCAGILLVKKLKFKRRVVSGIDGDASTGRRKYRKSKKSRRPGGDGPLRGGKRRGVVLVSSLQNSFPCIAVSTARTPEGYKFHLHSVSSLHCWLAV
jgi:hypothetical protein